MDFCDALGERPVRLADFPGCQSRVACSLPFVDAMGDKWDILRGWLKDFWVGSDGVGAAYTFSIHEDVPSRANMLNASQRKTKTWLHAFCH